MKIVFYDMAAVKAALETGGICGCTMVQPFESAALEEKEEIKRLLYEYGVSF